jgi:hypothetical protein
MSTISLRRGEKFSLPFIISDANNGLVGKRVTWAISRALRVPNGVPDLHLAAPVLKKTSALPGSSSEVTISSQTASQITGTINLTAADYTTLSDTVYAATLWIDDGSGNDRPVTDGGADVVCILETSPRS